MRPRTQATKPAAPALLPRQRDLLALVHAVGEGVGRSELWGVMLLWAAEPGNRAPYEVVLGAAGPVSFTGEADRRKLVERGFLMDHDARWTLTDLGRAEAAGPLVREVPELRGEALAERVRQRAARPATDGAGLSTIGYEGRSLEGYLNELLRAGVTLLCDVRRNPLSRKFGFAKSTLAKACASVGIRYEHLPELGIASEQRKSLETQAEYDALFLEYARETLPREGAALSKIEGWVRAGERVALTCYERAPEQCHRHCVADVLEHRLDLKARAL